LLVGSINTTKKNIEALLITSKKTSLQLNAEKIKYALCLCVVNGMQDKITTERQETSSAKVQQSSNISRQP
jgi:hypothetical protein